MTHVRSFLSIFYLLYSLHFAIKPTLAYADKTFNAQKEASSFYTLMNENDYRHIVQSTREELVLLMHKLKAYAKQSADKKIAFIVNALLDRPYAKEAMGEGDWVATSLVYQPGALHINQNPLYRLDKFDCQTFVQIVMTLLHSETLAQFDKNILNIAYGALNSSKKDIVHDYNRNHFVSADFNPINQKNGYLSDVTTSGNLSPYKTYTSAIIDRKNLFSFQEKNLKKTVYVFNEIDGKKMVARFKDRYSSLHFPKLKPQMVRLSYIPKSFFVKLTPALKYAPNTALLDQIKTPAVVEIVRDAKKWQKNGTNIKNMIGTQLNVSHIGILYRETFKKGEVIYYKITCNFIQHQKECVTKPFICSQKTCTSLMLAHATDAHPDHYYWYKNSDGNKVCTRKKATSSEPYSRCNRIERLPLFDYLTNFQYGHYWYMQDDSILGLHIEKLL